jgi:hypothetical protein
MAKPYPDVIVICLYHQVTGARSARSHQARDKVSAFHCRKMTLEYRMRCDERSRYAPRPRVKTNRKGHRGTDH